MLGLGPFLLTLSECFQDKPLVKLTHYRLVSILYVLFQGTRAGASLETERRRP